MSFDYKRLIKFEHNIGAKEAKLRMMIGAAALLVSIFTASILLLIVGLVMVAEGYVGWCPMYSALHKNTCEVAAETPPASE
jgi:hypothetical protein